MAKSYKRLQRRLASSFCQCKETKTPEVVKEEKKGKVNTRSRLSSISDSSDSSSSEEERTRKPIIPEVKNNPQNDEPVLAKEFKSKAKWALSHIMNKKAKNRIRNWGMNIYQKFYDFENSYYIPLDMSQDEYEKKFPEEMNAIWEKQEEELNSIMIEFVIL